MKWISSLYLSDQILFQANNVIPFLKHRPYPFGLVRLFLPRNYLPFLKRCFAKSHSNVISLGPTSTREKEEPPKGSPEDLSVYWEKKGNERAKEGDYQTAISYFENSLKCISSNTVVLLNRAVAYEQMNMLERSLKDCKSAIYLEYQSGDPSNTLLYEAYFKLGLLEMRFQNFVRSRIAFFNAMRIAPENEKSVVSAYIEKLGRVMGDIDKIFFDHDRLGDQYYKELVHDLPIEIRTVEGKGRGLFALKDFSIGDTLWKETSAVTLALSERKRGESCDHCYKIFEDVYYVKEIDEQLNFDRFFDLIGKDQEAYEQLKEEIRGQFHITKIEPIYFQISTGLVLKQIPPILKSSASETNRETSKDSITGYDIRSSDASSISDIAVFCSEECMHNALESWLPLERQFSQGKPLDWIRHSSVSDEDQWMIFAMRVMSSLFQQMKLKREKQQQQQQSTEDVATVMNNIGRDESFSSQRKPSRNNISLLELFERLCFVPCNNPILSKEELLQLAAMQYLLPKESRHLLNEETFFRLKSLSNLNSMTFWSQSLSFTGKMADPENMHLSTTVRDRLELVGLFPLATLLNHGCEPNVCTGPVLNGHREVPFIARKAIRKGQELCWAYVDHKETEKRRRTLLNTYYFWCKCERCTTTTTTTTTTK